MTTADEEMILCAADLTTCVAPCAVIQCMLRHGPNNKDDHSEDDYDEDNRGGGDSSSKYIGTEPIIEYLLREASKTY